MSSQEWLSFFFHKRFIESKLTIIRRLSIATMLWEIWLAKNKSRMEKVVISKALIIFKCAR